MAGIVVGALVFITCVVTGVVVAIILTYFKCRYTRYFVKVNNYGGIGNPNYDDVTVPRGTLSQKLQPSAAVPGDYEVPISINSYQTEQPLQPGQPTQPYVNVPISSAVGNTQQYVNIPNQNRTSSSIGESGDYSYVEVQLPLHPRLCPKTSHDSNFLQSSEDWDDLPTVVAAESGDSGFTSTYHPY